MKIVFSKTIASKEKLTDKDFKILISACSKGIFAQIKGSKLPKHSKLIKLYITSIGGSKRAVFLKSVKSETDFFLMYRSKNDPVGKNISIKNPVFRKTLHKYLEKLKVDLLEDNIKVFDL